jgi:glycosyltransferase involved in cell wall biosynthesis
MIAITHIITGLNTGGAEIMLNNLVSGMDRNRFDINVVSLTDLGPVGAMMRDSGIPVHTLDMKAGRPNPVRMAALVKLLRKLQPDIVQTWLYHADLLGLLAAKMSGVPSLFWNIRCSKLRREDHSALLFMLLRLLAHFSSVPDAVIVNSNEGRRVHESLGYVPRRWEVIPNGFDLDEFIPDHEARLAFRQEIGISEQTPLIGLVARFNPMKDHPTFLDAAALLAKRRPDVHFVLVGRGITRENPIIAKYLQIPSLRDRLHLFPERTDVARVNASLDIATCSSYSEGFPNVIGEAMSCGIPCVVTDVGDSAYLVGDTGILVPPSNPKALAEGWETMLASDICGRRKIGERGRGRVKELFSLDRVIDRYSRLYSEAYEAKRSGRQKG